MMTHNSKGITDEQIIDAVQQFGGFNGAAKHLGCDRKNVSKRYKRLRPDNDLSIRVTEGFTVKGISDYTRTEEGARWTKYDIDKVAQVEALEQLVESLKETIKPVKPIKPPKQKPKHLINQYTITDYHLGLYTDPNIGGKKWNTEKAEGFLVEWFQTAINQAPDSEIAIFAQLGDFVHYQDEPVTPEHGHILDGDTKAQTLVRIWIRVIRKIITLLLQKHNYVHIVNASGNHDRDISGFFREMLAELYRDEPRVTVDTSADIYYCYHFHNVSLFYHHGHKRNPNNISSVFAAKFRKIFGETEYSYAHLGHKHSSHVVEDNLMVCEQHPTLAASDAYATHGGWISKRAAKVITYHKDYGKVGEIHLTPEMVEKLT
jgi:hypothetical protein